MTYLAAASQLLGARNSVSYTVLYTDSVTLRCPVVFIDDIARPSWGRIVQGHKVGVSQCYDKGHQTQKKSEIFTLNHGSEVAFPGTAKIPPPHFQLCISIINNHANLYHAVYQFNSNKEFQGSSRSQSILN
jgi:hypothetical protein